MPDENGGNRRKNRIFRKGTDDSIPCRLRSFEQIPGEELGRDREDDLLPEVIFFPQFIHHDIGFRSGSFRRASYRMPVVGHGFFRDIREFFMSEPAKFEYEEILPGTAGVQQPRAARRVSLPFPKTEIVDTPPQRR